jgi:hypothetical protein
MGPNENITDAPRAASPGHDLETVQGQHAALDEILAGQRRSPGYCGPGDDGTYDLGVLLACYLKYLGSDILAVAETALSASGIYGRAMQVREMREAIERGESA